jgi:hypothetical protein
LGPIILSNIANSLTLSKDATLESCKSKLDHVTLGKGDIFLRGLKHAALDLGIRTDAEAGLVGSAVLVEHDPADAML